MHLLLARSNRRRWSLVLGASALAVAVASPAFAAPGVDPGLVDRSANPATSFIVDKIVHTPVIPPNPDVVLLVDTTGSMGGPITNIRNNLHQVITDVQAAQPTAQLAVASYRDTGDGAELFRVRQDLTANEPALQAAVDGLAAGGGGDTPEAWINALFQVSTGAISYRPGSSRIVVLVGDSSSHDPSNGHTLADAIAALQASAARVIAVAVSGGGNGLNAAGQATAVVNATGGQLVPATADNVTTAILNGLHNLDVTVTPVVVCDAGLSVTFDAPSKTQVSGSDVPFVETVHVAAGATQGATLHCTVDFQLNGASAGPAFVEQITVHVNDVTPPVVTVNDQTVEATSPAGAVINYPATAVDNVDGPLTPTCVPPPGTTFPLGGTLVTCTATDAAGNVGSDTATMTVVDTTPPTAACTPTGNPSGNPPPSDNKDGFFQISSTDIVDTAVAVFIRDTASPTVNFGPFPTGTKIKLVQDPDSTPSVAPGMGGIDYKVKLRGDALIVGIDDFGNVSAPVTCLVPPRPA